MKVKRKLKGLIAMLICVVTVLGSMMTAQAAGNPYPTTQDVDGDGNYEIPCTYFAWQQVYDNLGISMPAWGNAGNWLAGARNSGYSTGNVARPNSVAVWSGDGYGHVAYVTSATGNTFTVNEGGRTDLDHTASHGVAYGYTLTNAVGETRPYDPGKTLIGFIYFNDTPPVEVSLSWSNSDCQWDTTNAYMYIEADTNVSGSFTEAGITVWNEAGQVVATKSENPGISGTHLNVWYNITDETGVALQPGTNYTYQFHTVFNGTRYESSVMNFRTNGQSANEWTQELSITDWRYGETANAPSASAKYGDVVYTYSTEENGTYTSEVPQAAGTYYVKATVEATEQYTGLEAVKEFHIEKAIPEFTVPTGLTMVYGDTLESVELPEGFHWYDSTELSGPVGEKEMYVYFVPADTDNYYEYEQIRVTITVQAKDLSGLKLDGIDKNTDLDKYEIKDGDTVLVKDTDYTISAVTEGDNVTVTVEFIGNYTGTTQAKYSLKEDTINTDDKENTDKNTVDDSKTDNDKSDKDAQSKDDKNADSKSEAKAPQTGDDYSVLLWAVIAVISGGTAVVLCKRTRFSNK